MVFWPRLPCLFNPFGWKKTWWNRTLHMVYIYIYIYIYIYTHYGSYTSTSKCWWVVTPNLDQRIKYAKLLVIIWLFDIAFATVHVWIAQNALSMCLRFTLCGFMNTVHKTRNSKKNVNLALKLDPIVLFIHLKNYFTTVFSIFSF